MSLLHYDNNLFSLRMILLRFQTICENFTLISFFYQKLRACFNLFFTNPVGKIAGKVYF